MLTSAEQAVGWRLLATMWSGHFEPCERELSDCSQGLWSVYTPKRNAQGIFLSTTFHLIWLLTINEYKTLVVKKIIIINSNCPLYSSLLWLKITPDLSLAAVLVSPQWISQYVRRSEKIWKVSHPACCWIQWNFLACHILSCGHLTTSSVYS